MGGVGEVSRLVAAVSHYVILLPDGTEISFHGPNPPPPEVMALLPEVVAAVAALTPGQLMAIRNRRRQEIYDQHPEQLRGLPRFPRRRR